MPTHTVGAIFDRTALALERLAEDYQALASQYQSHCPLAAELATLLAKRERDTVAALAKYRANEHPLALDVHVRLSSAFPFVTDELRLPKHPTLDELVEHAERVDALLDHLGERIEVYAASRPLAEILVALRQIVIGRRRQLAGALNEFDEFEPLNSRPT